MFRSMRRLRQALCEAECVKILERGTTGVLGLIGDGGWPYTVPMNYVYRDGRIYLHSAREGHRVEAIRRDGRASFCVIDRDEIVPERLTDYYRSVIAFGTARILETESETRAAAELLGLRFNPDLRAVREEISASVPRLCCIELKIEHMTGKQAVELLGND